MHFIQFKSEPDDVEDTDDFEFIPGLEFRRQHEYLCQDAHEQNEIIARQKRDFDEF